MSSEPNEENPLADSQNPDGKDRKDKDSDRTLDGKLVQYRSPRQYRASHRIAVLNLLTILLAFLSLFQVGKAPQFVLFFSMLSLVLFLIQALIPRTIDGENRWLKWSPKNMILSVGAPVIFSAYAVIVTVLAR